LEAICINVLLYSMIYNGIQSLSQQTSMPLRFWGKTEGQSGKFVFNMKSTCIYLSASGGFVENLILNGEKYANFFEQVYIYKTFLEE
jgi:hypothetical protein